MKTPLKYTAISILSVMLAGCTKNNPVVKPAVVVTDTTTKTQPTSPVTTTPVPQNVVINMGGATTSLLASGFNFPSGMAIDKQGNVFVADALNNCIRKIALDGTVTAVAGILGSQNGDVDGPAATAQFYRPCGVVFDSKGNLFIADANNFCIRKLTPDGTVSTFASVDTPIAIAIDANDNLYTSRFAYTSITKTTPDGTVSTLVNGGGDGMAGLGINFSPAALATDANGNVYASDYPLNNVRKIAPDGTVTNITLNGPVTGPNGNYIDGNLADAHFHGITGITVDATGLIYIADWGNNAIRVIDTKANTVKTLAGNGSGGTFGGPEALAIDGSGNIYVAEPNKISKIVH